tara:strand:- start:855 stop:2552 length:1698 start_codon:yes stop_codon:yes gene_type:complete
MKLLVNLSKFKLLLNRKDRNHFNIILIYQFLGSVLEAFGIALILPLLSIFLNQTNQFTDFYSNLFGLDNNKLLISGLLIIIIFYFLKNFLLGIIYKKIFNFAFRLQYFIKSEVYSNFINQNFKKFISKGSSNFMSVLSVDLNIFTQNFIISLLVFLTEFFVILSISFFLIMYEPFGFLVLGLISSIFIFLFIKTFRKRINKLGDDKQIAEEKLQKILNNTINSFQAVKIFGKEDFFEKKFNFFNYDSSNLYGKFNFLQHLPRLIFEVFVVFLMVSLVSVLYLNGYAFDQMFIKIAIFAAAAFRLMPSINRIVYCYQGIVFSESTLNKIIDFNESNKDLKKNRKVFSHTFEDLELKKINFKYKDKEIFNDLNIKIKKGEFIGVYGESGSGKTTFVNIVSGLLESANGEYFLNSKNIKSINENWKNIFGYVPQFVNLIDDTLIQNITMCDPKDIDHKLFSDICEKMKIKELIDKYGNENIGERGIKISGGQFQRINLARALYHKPSILIMDEATSALDNETERKILDTVLEFNSKENLTVILISHKLENLKSCNRKFSLDNKNLIEQ